MTRGPGRGRDETVANIFARAFSETGSVTDAFWVTEMILRRGSTHDTGAAGLNDLVADVARIHGLQPKQILGIDRSRAVAAARFEVWWKLRQLTPPLSYPAIGIAFDKDHSTVIEGVQKFERWISERAELRARLTWEAAECRRAA